VNPNDDPADIAFYFTDAAGALVREGTFSLGSHEQIATFLTEAPFGCPGGFSGSLTLSATVPVAVAALEGLLNQRAELLMSTSEVWNLDRAPQTAQAVLAHFASGMGWITELALVNPTDRELEGNIQLREMTGAAVSPTLPFLLPPRAAVKMRLPGNLREPTGSVKVTAPGGVTPLVLGRVIYAPAGIPLTVAGLAPSTGNSFRTYVEVWGGRTDSGVALANPGSWPLTVSLELIHADGRPGLTTSLLLPGNGQVARMLSQFFPGLWSFRGTLRVTTSSPEGLSMASLRTRYNSRNEFVVTTSDVIPDPAPPVSELFLPHIASGGGYVTEVILINSGYVPFDGELHLFAGSGEPAGIPLD
jgi:hypothetical protein